jgi:hypothetical protein
VRILSRNEHETDAHHDKATKVNYSALTGLYVALVQSKGHVSRCHVLALKSGSWSGLICRTSFVCYNNTISQAFSNCSTRTTSGTPATVEWYTDIVRKNYRKKISYNKRSYIENVIKLFLFKYIK